MCLVTDLLGFFRRLPVSYGLSRRLEEFVDELIRRYFCTDI
jgi:hypothetical protein